jgi:hypothetical protein
MKRIAMVSLVLALGNTAASAQAPRRQRVVRVPRAQVAAVGQVTNYGYVDDGMGMGLYTFGYANAYPVYGYPIYGYATYGYGYPAYARPVYGVGYGGHQGRLPAYDYTTDPFGGSPNGGNYDYWLTQQAAHGNISWAEANKRMHGH